MTTPPEQKPITLSKIGEVFRQFSVSRSDTSYPQYLCSHLAERFETFVTIALGETIVLTGATASVLGFDAARFTSFALAFLSTACLYWLYFDDFPRIAKRRLELGPDGNHLARDAYMFLHVVLVAG